MWTCIASARVSRELADLVTEDVVLWRVATVRRLGGPSRGLVRPMLRVTEPMMERAMACCNRALMMRGAVAFALAVASWATAGCGALIGVDLGEPNDLDANPSRSTLDEAGIGAPPDRSTSGVDDAAVADAAASDPSTSFPAAAPPSDAAPPAVSD